MPKQLPLEIIQVILFYLDIETYAAARLTCRQWRAAASFPSMIRIMIQRSPIKLPTRANLFTMEEWRIFFVQISRLNLLSHRARIQKSQFKRKVPKDCTSSAVLGSSRDNRKLAILQGPQVRVYGYEKMYLYSEFSLALSLYPFWTSVCRALMESTSAGHISVNKRYSKHCISISSRGNLVAIGLGRTVQIYDLSNHHDSSKSPVELKIGQCDTTFAYPPGGAYQETDGIIESLEFVEKDSLLRVAIDKETTVFRPTRVRYLGRPSYAPKKPNLAYWKANINHVYLDSVALGVALGVGLGAPAHSIFRGLELLPPSYSARQRQRISHKTRDDVGVVIEDTGRYFVAALLSGDTHGYCIGYVSPITMMNEEEQQPQTVHILRLFPSRYNQFKNSIVVDPIQHSAHPINLYSHDQGGSTNDATTTTSSSSSSTSTSSFKKENRERITYYSNLQNAISRWNPINLPSAMFSSPLLAVSDDARLLAIYEPGKGSASPILSEGGSIYVCSLEDGEIPVPHPGSSSSLHDEPENLNSEVIETASRPTLPLKEKISLWPFLLDFTHLDVENLRISRCQAMVNIDEEHGWRRKKSHCISSRKEHSWYKVTAVAGDQVSEWKLK